MWFYGLTEKHGVGGGGAFWMSVEVAPKTGLRPMNCEKKQPIGDGINRSELLLKKMISTSSIASSNLPQL